MTEFRVPVVRIGDVVPVEGADALEKTMVWDYPVVIRKGQFKKGDLAVYVPIDSVVPLNQTFAFLGHHNRIKAKRLRGVFSMGLLIEVPLGSKEGEDVRELLGILKYQPPEHMEAGGDMERCPFNFPVYTDIEGLRRWPDILKIGERVRIDEKIEGENGRWVFRDGRLWAGSRTTLKKPNPQNKWWAAANQLGLEERLRIVPGIALYGEIYGHTGGFPYDRSSTEAAPRVRFFDAFDLDRMRYYDTDEFKSLLIDLKLLSNVAPTLYSGPWDPAEAVELAEGQSAFGPNVREGVVVRPVRERFDSDLGGRVILKLAGQGYLLAKGKL